MNHQWIINPLMTLVLSWSKQPPIAPPAGGQAFNIWACGEHFTFKPWQGRLEGSQLGALHPPFPLKIVITHYYFVSPSIHTASRLVKTDLELFLKETPSDLRTISQSVSTQAGRWQLDSGSLAPESLAVQRSQPSGHLLTAIALVTVEPSWAISSSPTACCTDIVDQQLRVVTGSML
jgi:hypothetical protein